MKKPRYAAAGQKEMLMPIAGKKPAKEAVSQNPRPGSFASLHDATVGVPAWMRRMPRQ